MNVALGAGGYACNTKLDEGLVAIAGMDVGLTKAYSRQ